MIQESARSVEGEEDSWWLEEGYERTCQAGSEMATGIQSGEVQLTRCQSAGEVIITNTPGFSSLREFIDLFVLTAR